MSEATWDSQFDPCACPDKCACGGVTTSTMAPYMRVLRNYRPRTVYEWGPGYSTMLAVGSGAVVQSVEHDQHFADMLPQSRGFHVCRVVPLDSDEYIAAQPAELYFVDGRRRAECIIKALECAKQQPSREAVLCLHDAQRDRYHEALRQWTHVRFLLRGFAVAGLTKIPEGL